MPEYTFEYSSCGEGVAHVVKPFYRRGHLKCKTCILWCGTSELHYVFRLHSLHTVGDFHLINISLLV